MIDILDIIKAPAAILCVLSHIVLLACVCVLPASNIGLPLSTHHDVEVLAMAAFAFWIMGRLIGRDMPRKAELLIWGGTLALVAYGWAVARCPSAWVDRSSGAILQLDRDLWRAFGTVDERASTRAMTTLSAVAMMFLMSVHAARDRGRRSIMAAAVTASGLLAAIAGLWLQTGPERMALWQVQHVPASVFGLFWYHGNAAAFLNLAWPAGVWLFVKRIQTRQRTLGEQALLALLIAAVFIQIVAVFANVSKMGHLMLMLELALIAGAWLHRWRGNDGMANLGMARVCFFGLVGVAVVGGGAWLTGADSGWSRWGEFSDRHFDDPARRHAVGMAMRMGMDAGWTGTGPGTFEWVSPHYAAADPLLRPGRWRHAHNDYAEFFAEWGAFGSALLAGALVVTLRPLVLTVGQVLFQRRSSKKPRQRSLVLLIFPIAMIACLVHALVDFPLQIMAIQGLFAVVSGLAVGLSLPPQPAGTCSSLKLEKERPGRYPIQQPPPPYFLSGI